MFPHTAHNLLAAPSWVWTWSHSLPQTKPPRGFCLLDSHPLSLPNPSQSFLLGLAKITFTGLCILFLFAYKPYKHQQHELLWIHYIKGIYFLLISCMLHNKRSAILMKIKYVHILLWKKIVDKKSQITTNVKTFINLNFYFFFWKASTILFWHQTPFVWSVLIFLH